MMSKFPSISTAKGAVVFVLLVLGECAAVDVQTQINLRGVGGETACSLRDQLNVANCDAASERKVVIAAQAADFFEAIPSSCTCNTPFFNVWSACELFELRSNALPYFGDWKTQCQNASLTFYSVTDHSLGSIQLPTWTLVEATTDDSVFDAAGVVLAAAPERWNTLQIAAPVVSAVLVLGVLSMIYFRRRRRQQKCSTPSLFERGPLGRFFRPSRVKREEPKGDWVIDRSDETIPFPARSSMSQRSDSGSLDQAAPAQNILQPKRYMPPRNDEHDTPPLDIRRGSGGTKWTGAVGAFQSVFEGVAISNPFKSRGPVRVKHMAPRPGFRLDDYDQNTETDELGGHRGVGIMRYDDRNSVFGEGHHHRWGSSVMQEVNEDQEERVMLISGEERQRNSVFLISKDGRDFRISDTAVTMSVGASEGVNSNIGIVSPTASTFSYRTALENQTRKVPPVPPLPPLRLPAPPKKPPPTPKPAKAPRYPLSNLPDDPGLPIRERSGPEESPKASRRVPIAVNQSSGPSVPPNLLHPPLRPVYEAERYPSHQGGLLDDDDASLYLSAAESSTAKLG